MKLIDDISRYEPERKYCDLYFVEAIVDKPAVAFQGIRFVDDSIVDRRNFLELPSPDGLCLAGVPKSRTIREDIVVPPPPGMTFAVYLKSTLSEPSE